MQAPDPRHVKTKVNTWVQGKDNAWIVGRLGGPVNRFHLHGSVCHEPSVISGEFMSFSRIAAAVVFVTLIAMAPMTYAQVPSACRATYASPTTVLDCAHFSSVLNEQRFFRVFLPLNYDQVQKYPVVYFFHAWGERYNKSSSETGNYDIGDTCYGTDSIAAYVGKSRRDRCEVGWL
jgi:hypothetical protein